MPAPHTRVLDNSFSLAPPRDGSARNDPEPGAQACLDYVRALPGVRFRTGKIVATGVSAGGLMSIPMASRYKVFTHAMLLHSRCTPSYPHCSGFPPAHTLKMLRLLSACCWATPSRIQTRPERE